MSTLLSFLFVFQPGAVFVVRWVGKTYGMCWLSLKLTEQWLRDAHGNGCHCFLASELWQISTAEPAVSTWYLSVPTTGWAKKTRTLYIFIYQITKDHTIFLHTWSPVDINMSIICELTYFTILPFNFTYFTIQLINWLIDWLIDWFEVAPPGESLSTW